MATAQESAEAKAAKEKEAAEAAAAAEAKAADEAAAEEVAAKAKADEEAKAADEAKAKSEPKTRGAAAASKGYTVTGAAVVLRTKDKAERYLYRGAVIPDGVYAEESIKHALSVRLIEKSK